MAIENVSDTARWVAEYRAMETDRPDAVFREMRGVWFWRFIMRFYPKRVREEMKRIAGNVLLERI